MTRPEFVTQHRLDEALAGPAHLLTGEFRVLTFRRQARRLVWAALICIATAGAMPYYAGSFLEPWQNWAVLIGGALVLLLCVVGPYVSWLARTTTISTKRIIARSGVLTRHRTELPFAQIREVKLKRGPIQRLFGAGNIVLEAGGETPLVLSNVPRVKVVAQAIQELVEWQYASQQLLAQGYGGPHYGGTAFHAGE